MIGGLYGGKSEQNGGFDGDIVIYPSNMVMTRQRAWGVKHQTMGLAGIEQSEVGIHGKILGIWLIFYTSMAIECIKREYHVHTASINMGKLPDIMEISTVIILINWWLWWNWWQQWRIPNQPVGNADVVNRSINGIHVGSTTSNNGDIYII